MINFDNVKVGDNLICIKSLYDFEINKEYELDYIFKKLIIKNYIGGLIFEGLCKSEIDLSYNFDHYDDYFIDKNSYRKDKLKKLL